MKHSPKGKVNVKEAPVNSDKLREHQLVIRARSGDREAIRSLVDSHKDRLFSFLWRMIHHHHDAEEICQETFLKAFACLDTFSSEFRFSTWLFTIGYRVCLNRLRRKRDLPIDVDTVALRFRGPDQSDVLSESEDANQLRETVWDAVDQLSPPQKATLLLFYRHELGCHDIARVLELPVATVKSHLHRGRARLREVLESADSQVIQQFRNQVG
ncbi:MAG: RNA polymerase sigma factor [Planctomycetota bacterium]